MRVVFHFSLEHTLDDNHIYSQANFLENLFQLYLGYKQDFGVKAAIFSTFMTI